MCAMKFMSVRELQKSTNAIKTALYNDSKIVLTMAGKPTALLIPTDETDFEDTILILNQLKLAKAINDIRQHAAQNDLHKMTMEEIDAEIAEARADSRKQSLLSKEM